MGPPLTHKKSHEKSIEKDPFIVAFTNNNDESIKTHRRNCKGDAPYNPVQSRKAPHSLSLYIGIFLLIVGLGCFIGSSQIEAAVLHLVQSYTSLVPGGPMFQAWFTPPIVPLLKVYVFNITNKDEVLEGADPITEELGPYVYSATHIRSLVEDDETLQGGSLSFRSRTNYKFLPHLSNGSESDTLTVLNMVMMTGFNKARGYMGLVKSGVVLPLLNSLGRKEPVLTVTVGGFLFGYEDELACITDFAPIAMDSDPKEEPSNDDFWMNGDDWDDEEWDEEEPNTVDDIFRSKRSVPSYRDPSGKCLWGILKDLNNTEHETIRIKTGTEDFRQKGKILSVDGRESFQAWEENSTCDRLKGGIEPSTLPADLPGNFSLFVPVMCRNIKMISQQQQSLSIKGIPVTRYTAEPTSLDQNPCYCPHPHIPCLPSGYLHLEPCYPEISPPLAVSFPHGLHSAPNSLLTHNAKPNSTSHSMFIDINTKLGVPLAVQASFQISAVLRPDSYFPILRKLNSTRLVPLFWASEGFSEPTSWMISQTKMALALPSLVSFGLPTGFVIFGLILLGSWGWTRRKRSKSAGILY